MIEENFIRRLIALRKCNVCGHCFEVDNVDILSHHGDLWFLRIICSACHARCLVAAVTERGSTAEVISDLTEADVTKFKHKKILTADDMLDMHNFLKNFDRDISCLLE